MADRPRSLDALRRAAYQMHADHEHDMATDPKYAAVVRRIGRSGALRSEDYQRAVQIVHANYWDVKESKIVQLYTMAKAAVTGQPPTELGEHGILRMR